MLPSVAERRKGYRRLQMNLQFIICANLFVQSCPVPKMATTSLIYPFLYIDKVVQTGFCESLTADSFANPCRHDSWLKPKLPGTRFVRLRLRVTIKSLAGPAAQLDSISARLGRLARQSRTVATLSVAEVRLGPVLVWF